ncbi:MAG: hypothetical protein PGN11_19235 [Quadrisphaera sp.]
MGTDGTKMSKSRRNAIELRASEDETAGLLRGARTDGERHITYEPQRRPEVANLLVLASLFSGRSPEALAEEVGSTGAGALKALVTEVVNEHLRPLRARRAELVADPGMLMGVLRAGNARANEVADATLAEVRSVMDMTY